MKRFIFCTLAVCCISLFSVLNLSCEKDDVDPPTVVTYAPINVTLDEAYCGGSVLDDGGGTISAMGFCWSEIPDPNITDRGVSTVVATPGEFFDKIQSLSHNTLYYVRAYATNEAGTAYGETMYLKTMFTTTSDVDGNIYYVVEIGDQYWMASNLKTTRFNNLDEIPNITDADEWGDLTTAAFNWYDNDYETYGKHYGALYNTIAVLDSRRICPDYYHIPSKDDWQELFDALGNNAHTKGKLRSAATQEEYGHPGWSGRMDWDTNESGFTGFPGGFCNYWGHFSGLEVSGYWITSTRSSDENMHGVFISSRDMSDYGFNLQGNNSATSVRCVRSSAGK